MTMWPRQPLGSLCRIVGGGTPYKGQAHYYSGTIPWATVRDLRSDVVSRTEYKITKEAVRNSTTNIIPRGNVVIATRVGLGKVSILAHDTAINQDLRGIIPHNTDSILTRFLFWWFKSISDRIIAEGTGATVQGVKTGFINALEVPLPSVATQKRIVAILDEVFDRTTKVSMCTESSLHNAGDLFARYLASTFSPRGSSWIDSTLGDCVRFIDYRGKTPTKTDTGLRLITAKNVKMGFVQDTPREFVAPGSYDSWMTRGIPKQGDVLFTTEAPLANVAQLNTDEKVVFAQRIIVLQPDSTTLRSSFLKYLLLSSPIQRLIHANGTGATVKGIKASLLKTIPISFPKSLTEQDRIIRKLDALADQTRAHRDVQERKLAALDDLKKSLLHHAFTGQL